MSNDGRKRDGVAPGLGQANGLIPASFRSLSRMASYGASTVRSAVLGDSAIVERDSDASHYQVLWAGFDKLEWEGSTTRQVLLLRYRSGFQVWDVEEADNVCDLVSRHDGPVSFMQVLPKPIASNRSGDKFGDSRPLLAICADESLSGDGNGNNPNCHYPVHGGFMPTVVWFYSLISQSYVNVLKFRSASYLVRCSTRVVVISQAAQIHCLDAATLEREYTILTNPIVAGYSGFGGIGCGPLAVGPRWLAYGGVAISNSGSVSPQHLTPSVSFPGSASNRSLVVHYAKESSKQLAAGIVTLGDMGYKKLSRYYSELLPKSNNPPQSGNPGWKVNGTVNGQLPDAENVGMIYFQSTTIDGEGAPGREIEIERIPARMIEARTPASNSSTNGQRLHQTSGLAEDGKLSCKSSCGSVDAMTDGVAVAELDSDIGETVGRSSYAHS